MFSFGSGFLLQPEQGCFFNTLIFRTRVDHLKLPQSSLLACVCVIPHSSLSTQPPIT